MNENDKNTTWIEVQEHHMKIGATMHPRDVVERLDLMTEDEVGRISASLPMDFTIFHAARLIEHLIRQIEEVIRADQATGYHLDSDLAQRLYNTVNGVVKATP